MLAPVPEPATKAERFGKHNFRIDLTAGTVTCPAGHTAAIPAQPSDGRRQVMLERREDLLEAGSEALRDPLQREHLRRTRPLIERLLGLLVHRYHARKSRYRGRRKAAFQAAWTAVLVNLHPIGAALRTQSA